MKMITLITLVLSGVIAVAWSAEDQSFPPGFKFGVASAAYQVEGAWNVSDKGESIWDRYCHENPDKIANGDSGDVACDSYHLWRQDIGLVADVGAQFYRISIAWSRLLPTGFHDQISEDGKRYYNDLIDGLLERGIEPVVTLYHWDLPQKLQDFGGWTNPLVSGWFADYARVAYTLFGDRVKTWITINEPWVVCDVAYRSGVLAPGIVSDKGAYFCNKNVLMAHAKAWRIYDEEFRNKYNGQVSFCNHLIWMEAMDEEEEVTAQNMREFLVGRYSHPIYSKEGGWPPVVEETLAIISKEQGYHQSLLPALTKDEIEFMKGTYDFYGVNQYSSRLVQRGRPGEALRPWPFGDCPEFNAKLQIHPDWPRLTPFFAIHPEGIRKQLAWLKKQYGDIPILITENGRGTRGGLHDIERIEYYRDYLKQVLLSIKEDGVNVTGYAAWTIMDNFEWMEGYTVKFGLYEVDFTSPQRTRTPRASATYYASIIKSHSLDVPYNFTFNITTKSSEPQHGQTKMIIISGLILVAVVVAIAALVRWRLKIKSRKFKKSEYLAVDNGNQNGCHGAQNGSHGTQNGTRGTQNGTNDAQYGV